MDRAVEGVRSWDDVKVLSVQVDRVNRWHAHGLLLIGDAAHAMSPIGGVGINLAVQDAAAAARLLAPALLDGRVSSALLARVQRRRMLPTVLTQRLQRRIEDRFVDRLLAGGESAARLESSACCSAHPSSRGCRRESSASASVPSTPLLQLARQRSGETRRTAPRETCPRPRWGLAPSLAASPAQPIEPAPRRPHGV